MEKKFETLDEVFEEELQDPQFKEFGKKRKPYNELITEFINRRNALYLTQKEVAKRANTFQSRISKIESGEHDFRLSTLIELAEALESELVIRLLPYEFEREGVDYPERVGPSVSYAVSYPAWIYKTIPKEYNSLEDLLNLKTQSIFVEHEEEVSINTGTSRVLAYWPGTAGEVLFERDCFNDRQLEKV